MKNEIILLIHVPFNKKKKTSEKPTLALIEFNK